MVVVETIGNERIGVAVSEEPISMKLTNPGNVIMITGGDELKIAPNELKRLSNALASGHLNFLIGSGFSASLIPTLGHREQWFTEAGNTYGALARQIDLLRAEYFKSVLLPAAQSEPKQEHLEFLQAIKDILKNRGNTSIPRRANIFTTNYDVIAEKSCEAVSLPYNDGFSGRLKPTFSTESFSHVLCEQSFAHDYLTQIPTVSIMKMHGSLSWKKDSGSVLFADPSRSLDDLAGFIDGGEMSEALEKVSELVASDPTEGGLGELCTLAERLSEEAVNSLLAFSEQYAALCIVNPTKRKFEETILELGYYELLRLFSNEMDRTNTLLISFGFSFRDEHIFEITKRALNNPKLLLIVFCYSAGMLAELQGKFEGFDNVWFVASAEEGEKVDASVASRIFNRVVHNG